MTREELLDLQAGRYLRQEAPILYLLVDTSGAITMANSVSREILGRDIERKHLRDIFLSFKEPLPDVTVLRKHAQESGRLFSVAMAEGPPQSFVFHFLPVGDQTLVVGTADIREHRKLQQRLLEVNRQFADLTRQLQKSNHQLTALNTLKNQFLGMAAHDLRKPVGAILAYSEFLLDEAAGSLNREHQGFLQIIHDSTAAMSRLIDDFLDVSLIEAGRFPLQLEEVDISGPLLRSLELQRLLAKKRHIHLELVQCDPSPVAVIDEHKIEQVANNLLVNAIEHAPENSKVTIRIHATEQQIGIQVIDQGPGLTPLQRDTLFQLYSCGQVKKTGGGRSTGLGLAIAKKIVEAHGGTIDVESIPGQGASFQFTIPRNPTLRGDTNDTQ